MRLEAHKNHWNVQQEKDRRDTIHRIFTAAAFPTISVISSTVLRYEDHFKRMIKTIQPAHKRAHTKTYKHTDTLRHKARRCITTRILTITHLTPQRHIYPRLRYLSYAITAQRYEAGFVSKCHGFYCERSPSDLLFLPRTLTAFHLIRFNLERAPQGINNCTKAL